MSETIEEAEFVFLAIYTAEMVIKIIAKGFALNKYTYLRNPVRLFNYFFYIFKLNIFILSHN